MIDPRLLKLINRGRCFVLVGSGPSCEVGYPSWEALAAQTSSELARMGIAHDAASYEKFLVKKKYPELFRQAEVDLGERDKLIELLRRLLNPSAKARGFLYELLCRWPFACYLTTNFDDEISAHLARQGEYFTVIRNRPDDFHPIRDNASHLIQKLHSDLDHPDDLVLTSADYRRLYVEDKGKYFRDKLRQVLEMFDVLIIGHSLADPDIDHILQTARQTANPAHPIYMVAADYSKAEERELLEKYNIVLIQYSNADGRHAKLRRLLSVADRYIAPRQARLGAHGVPSRPREETEAASAMFLFRRLQGLESSGYMVPLVLSVLASADAGGLTRDDLTIHPILSAGSRSQEAFSQALDEALSALLSQGFVTETPGKYRASETGTARVRELHALRETEKDQAYGQFVLDMKRGYPDLTKAEADTCRMLAEKVVVAGYSGRGLAIANQVFAGQTADREELSDIFGLVTGAAAELNSLDLRAAFVEAMHHLLVEPSPPQKQYLASISQGYFLYHLLGHDPTCARLRKQTFEETAWICDSSVILPLLAVGCLNHDYAVVLFRKLRESNAVLLTTRKLLRETLRHFAWACDFIKTNGIDSPEFLRAALVKGSYKQNLFLDGFIRRSAEGEVGTFADYLEAAELKKCDMGSVVRGLERNGIQVLDLPSLAGFQQDDWGSVEESKKAITDRRIADGTIRGPDQAEAEAEVWVLVSNLASGKYKLPGAGTGTVRVYFMSQSRLLDRVFKPEKISTWTPEAVYRYISALPGESADPKLLQQCMLHEFYYAGVAFIDKVAYGRFFGPSVSAAKLSYDKEKQKYVELTEAQSVRELDEAFERTPDLEKPFFVAQMGWKVAEVSQKREEDAKRRATEAESRARTLQAEKDSAWKKRGKSIEEQKAARQRNLQDPKHVRKRLKQAKKRRKRKNK